MTRAADVKNLALRPDQIQTLRDAANAYSAILEFRRASSLLFVDTWGKGGLGALWKLFKEEMPRLDGMWLSRVTSKSQALKKNRQQGDWR